MADNREHSAEIARLRAVSKDALEQAKKLEEERDVRYAVYWDGNRASFGGTCTWEDLPHDDRNRIRAGIDALDQFDRAAAARAAGGQG